MWRKGNAKTDSYFGGSDNKSDAADLTCRQILVALLCALLVTVSVIRHSQLWAVLTYPMRERSLGSMFYIG